MSVMQAVIAGESERHPALTKETGESLPRSAVELEGLAAYYDAHDTSAEMDHGRWIDPRPMQE